MTHASSLIGFALALALAGGCKKDESKAPAAAATSAPAAAEKPAGPAVAPPATPPAASDADCKSTKEFVSVEACVALCEAGNANACYVAGSSYLVGDKTDESEPQAGVYFTKGCDKDSPFACKWLAPMHHNGLGGIQANPDQAKALQDKARTLYGPVCDGGDMQACVDLAGLISDSDPARAKALYQKGCDAGWAGACDLAK